MGADINPIVIFVRRITGSRTWKDIGCITKIVDRKNNTRVAMEKPLILDIMLPGRERFWTLEAKVVSYLAFFCKL